MADSHGTPDDKNLNELLSQLKGIFGHLSEAEKEESRQKIVPPSPPPSSPNSQPIPIPIPEPPTPESPVEITPEPAPVIEPSSTGMPMPDLPVPPPEGVQTDPQTPLDPWVPPSEPAARMAEPAPIPPAGTGAYTPSTPHIPAGAFLFPAAIFYPTGRTSDAKIVAEKIERMTPKFTKVTFVLNIQALNVYDPKADIKSAVTSQTGPAMKAIFLLTEKPLDDARRKAMSAELEPRGVYFQEILLSQIEKKALYTDMLLGLVFFYDSQKPTESAS